MSYNSDDYTANTILCKACNDGSNAPYHTCGKNNPMANTSLFKSNEEWLKELRHIYVGHTFKDLTDFISQILESKDKEREEALCGQKDLIIALSEGVIQDERYSGTPHAINTLIKKAGL